MLGCDTMPFTYSAFFSGQGTPTAALATTTNTNPLVGLSTSPNFESTPTSTTPLPSVTSSSSSSSSGFSSTTTITIIVVGAVVALIGGIVFLWFLLAVWKSYHKARNARNSHHQQTPLMQQAPFMHQGPFMHQSSTSLNSQNKKKGGLSKWNKVAGVVASVFTMAGVGVTIYFGVKQSK